jgi:hypothetical protein
MNSKSGLRDSSILRSVHNIEIRSSQIPMTEISASKSPPPADLLKIVTWNVASLRAAWEHGFDLYVKHTDPDILYLQETKMSWDAKPPVESMKLPGYRAYFLHAKKKGYSGTAIYTKYEPLSIRKSDTIPHNIETEPEPDRSKPHNIETEPEPDR